MPVVNAENTSKMEEQKSISDFFKNGNNSSNNGDVGSGNGDDNSSKPGRRKFGENGFEEQGGYMAAKKAKLDNQFNNSIRQLGFDQNSSDIFKGVSIHVNGYTNPPEPELKEHFIRNGGTIHPYCTPRTKYVIATNLSEPSKRLYGSKAVIPDWIMDSIAAKKPLDVRKYMLYDLVGEKKQMTLTQVMQAKFKEPITYNNTNAETNSLSSRTETETVVKNGNHQDVKVDDEDVLVESDEDEFFECSQDVQVSSSHSYRPSMSSSTPPDILENQISDSGKSSSETTSQNSNGKRESENSLSVSKVSEVETSIDSSSSLSPTRTDSAQGRIKTANDDGFMEDFFGKSRLHLISEQKKDMQILIGNMRKNIATNPFPNLQKFKAEIESSPNGMDNDYYYNDKVTLMHVDLDCFFASVGLLSRPHLRGKPIVVTHSTGKGQDSKSDIACASYEARKYGIKNGMWVGDAKAMCAELEVIPYDFEEYRRISKRFFEIVSSVTLDIEPNSVDEMVVDVSSILKSVPGSSPELLAEFLRKIILDGTQCPASVGIGSNRLLAKLAVKLAKPNGIHHLKDVDAPEYIANLDVRDLPGVGFSNEEKLCETFGVRTCGDLLKVSLVDLKSVLGEKTAEKMLNLCKGVDTSELKFGFDRPKSISVDVNFGIRFTKDEDITSFMNKICKELSNRAEKIQALSTHFTLKLLIRKKGAGMPMKQGGHGLVDSITRSRTLLNPTRNHQELYKTACSLIRGMAKAIPASEYRGVGVGLGDLTFDCDKNNKRPVQRTLMDMPLSRAQKMLAMSKNKNKAPSVSSAEPNVTNITKESSVDNENGVCLLDESDKASVTSSILSNGSDTTAGLSANKPTTERKSVISFAPESKTCNNNKKPFDLDISVLRQLPRELAEEQCAIYGLDKNILDQQAIPKNQTEESQTTSTTKNENGSTGIANYYEQINSLDQEYLEGLPDNLRQDVLIEFQKAKGRRNLDAQENNQDDQPCTSKQAIERNQKLIEKQQAATIEAAQLETNKLDKEREKQNNTETTSMEEDEQKTPIISYSTMPPKPLLDPKTFWDMTYECQVLPPKKLTLPALNELTEIDDIRNLIRDGLEIVTDPTSDDVEPLKQYFKELVVNGWLCNSEILLKFLRRQIQKMGDESSWTPILKNIIDESQRTCKSLYHGVFNLES